MHKHVTYYIPKLERRVNITLYSNAAECYNLLENQGHIELLERIKQLGVISNVYKSAYHSRLEYTMVHLHLIQQLNEEEKGIGLRRDKIKIGKYKASGVELLQIWTLLFNAGHLNGTFASERAVLGFLINNPSSRESFIKGLPKNPTVIKEKFEEIIENRNSFLFHRILISFYLENYKKNSSAFHRALKGLGSKSVKVIDPKFIDFLQEIIGFYEKRKDKRLIEIFKNLRMLSYLFLDSQHVNFPISFDLSEILLNFPEYIQGIINSQIIKTLDSFEDFLSLNMYHSSDSIREIGYHVNKIEEKL